MFKRIVHYFTSKSLESHRIKTQCMIEEYEQASAASQARIAAQVASCTAALQSRREQREVSIQELAKFLDEHLEQTGEHVPLLLQLQDALLACLGHWASMKLAEERVQLQYQKIKLIAVNRDLLDEAEAAIARLSQQYGRHAWQMLTAHRPLRTCTPEMGQYIKKLGQEAESDAKAYDLELRRIRSHRRLMRKQTDELRTNLEQIQATELQPAREAHQQSRTNVQDVYRRCHESWTELQLIFEHYFVNERTQSDLANRWLAQQVEGGTLDELRQLLNDTKSDWEDAKKRNKDLQKRRGGIQEKIDRAHNLKDFATLERDKRERGELKVAVQQAFEYQAHVFNARQIIATRRDEIRNLLEWIRPFHPASVAEQFRKRIEKDGADLYRQAIGLKVHSPRPPMETRA